MKIVITNKLALLGAIIYISFAILMILQDVGKILCTNHLVTYWDVLQIAWIFAVPFILGLLATIQMPNKKGG